MDTDYLKKMGLGGRPDYSDIDVRSEEQIKEEKRLKIVEDDIELISKAISSDDGNEMLKMHETIDAKYHAYIPGWGESSYCFSRDFGFNYSALEGVSSETLIHNLRMMSGMLENYRNGFKVPLNEDKSVNVAVNNSNENHNENNINIDLTFDQARQKLEDMPGLDQHATEELQGKVDELENISKDQSSSKKKKWEKVKPILQFAIDKGADIAIMFMELALQMKLGL